jgi:cell wall-associated NlpC family hydrolase
MRPLKILLVCGLVVVLMGFGFTLVVMNMMGVASTQAGMTYSDECSTTVLAGGTPTRLDAEQARNARVIVQTGLELKIPPKGLVVAIATAMQESTLKNLDHGDRDSLGLFQQRAAWGAAEKRMDPAASARMFFLGGEQGQPGLLDKPGWKNQPVTQAAQSVQVSAFPDAYAKWEPLAVQTVRELLGVADARATAPVAGGSVGEFRCGQVAGEQVPRGTIGEVLRSALDQLGVPYFWGGVRPETGLDCSGLVVHAWRKAGYLLTIRTSQQMYAHSDPVEPEQAGPGDLVFNHFAGGSPGHVMMLVNKDWVIQAPHSGDVVKLTEFDPNSPGQTIGRLKAEVIKPLPR